jgi:hypothetical protein
MLMALVALVEKGTADQAQLKARDALAFAAAQNWKDQQVVVTMLVAGALLKEQRHDQAVAAYRNARATAALTQQENHPASAAMVLQTWFGEGGVELAAGRVSEAAAAYDSAAVAAQEARNLVLAIEAFRMGAFCHARLGERDAAITRGVGALTTGERLRCEVRGMTTLPLAASDLLQVLDEDSATAIESIRTRGAQDMERLNDALEQRADLLDRTADRNSVRDAQETFASGRADLAQQADQELATVVAEARVEFRQAFARARRLLGDAWPLGEALSLAAAGEEHVTP